MPLPSTQAHPAHTQSMDTTEGETLSEEKHRIYSAACTGYFAVVVAARQYKLAHPTRMNTIPLFYHSSASNVPLFIPSKSIQCSHPHIGKNL